MSKTQRSSGLTRLLFAVAVGVIPIGLSCVSTRCLAQDYGGGQDPGGLEMPNLGHSDDFDHHASPGLTYKNGQEEPACQKGRRSRKGQGRRAQKRFGWLEPNQIFRRDCSHIGRELHWVPQLEINGVRDAENSI